MRLRTAHRHRDRAANHGKKLGRLIAKAASGRPLTQWESQAYVKVIAIAFEAIADASRQVVRQFREGLIPAIKRFRDKARQAAV